MNFDFLSLKSSVGAIRERHSALCDERQKVRDEIAAVRNARMNRVDVVALVDQWIERTATGFDAAVAASVTRRLGGSSAAPLDMSFVGLFASDHARPTAREIDAALCNIHGSQIRANIVGAIGRMDWPGEGLPATKRAEKLAALGEREKTITKELEKIARDAADAGIDI